MNPLQNTRTYLAGPVEMDINCVGWRQRLTPKLQELGITVWDPLVKPSWMVQIDAPGQIELKRRLIETAPDAQVDIDIIQKNKAIRQFCLAYVRNCDFMIVHLNNMPTVGTFDEIKLAEGKPIFIVSEKPIYSMWLVEQLSLYDDRKFYMHQSFDSLIDALKNIDINKLDPYKWIFLKNFCST